MTTILKPYRTLGRLACLLLASHRWCPTCHRERAYLHCLRCGLILDPTTQE